MAQFTKICIDAGNKCEACAVFDVDNNGIPDIVCGEYWYEGPDFIKKHKICDINYEHEYVWDFCNYPVDVNNDGYLDIITGSWWDSGLFWRQNPGDNGRWETIKICDLTNVETIRFYDIDGDGEMEIFPNCPGEPVFFIKLEPGTGASGSTVGYKKYVISEANAGHGLGVGDIDGDGQLEVITAKGIYHMPPEGPFSGLWDYSEEFDLGSTSVPILVHDVNKDGLNDLIYGAGHNYGLFWLEQKKNPDGSRSWKKHVIDGAWSQYHDIQLADINNDGELELVTGKRYKAHNGNDPGDAREVFVCYYTFVDNTMYRHMVEYGDPENGASGAGIYFWTADVTGNGKLDIVAPGKEGLYLFAQE